MVIVCVKGGRVEQKQLAAVNTSLNLGKLFGIEQPAPD